MVVTFDPATCTTYGLAMGLCPHQASRLTEALRVASAQTMLPILLPLAWLNVLGETRARRVWGRKRAIDRLEMEMGIHWSSDEDTKVKSWRNFDFDILTRALTVLGSELAWDMRGIEAQLEMVAALSESYAAYCRTGYEGVRRATQECEPATTRFSGRDTVLTAARAGSLTDRKRIVFLTAKSPSD